MNQNLNKAKAVKDDEFYTRLEDIDREIAHYKSQLKGKRIYCNCDNPKYSKFWQYFYDNFHKLELKWLVASYFKQGGKTKVSLYNGKTIKTMSIDGDFRSRDSVKILKAADIVITNPPFSLFKQFMTLLLRFKKRFLVIGNFNAVKYKEIFPMIQINKLWLGVSPRSMMFIRPDGNMTKVNAVWFTNIPHHKRNEMLTLTEPYNKSNYQQYDNYNAIEVPKTALIPIGYEGLMGVPITFLDKFNPNQFDIVDVLIAPRLIIDGNVKEIYSRIIIRHK